MKIDLTTKIDKVQFDKWLEKYENSHLASGHYGTHLDTYQKTPISLDYMTSEGVLIDVSSFCEEREVQISDVQQFNIKEGAFVLFRTGRIEKAAYGTEAYFLNHPQLSHELIKWLLSKKIHFIGIDCSGIRRGDEHRDADILCEENGAYVIENLCELGQLAGKEFTVYTMWLDDPELTGLKCRVVAETK